MHACLIQVAFLIEVATKTGFTVLLWIKKLEGTRIKKTDESEQTVQTQIRAQLFKTNKN